MCPKSKHVFTYQNVLTCVSDVQTCVSSVQTCVPSVHICVSDVQTCVVLWHLCMKWKISSTIFYIICYFFFKVWSYANVTSFSYITPAYELDLLSLKSDVANSFHRIWYLATTLLIIIAHLYNFCFWNPQDLYFHFKATSGFM